MDLKNKQTEITPQQESTLIRNLLSERRILLRRFQPEMEAMFWRGLAERTANLIRGLVLPTIVVYVLLGLISLPLV